MPENTPAPSPGTEAPAPTAIEDPKSTADISTLLARAAFHVPAETPSNDPDLKKGTIRCYEIQEIKNDIAELQDERDSIYRVQAQLSTLGPNLEANTIIKPETKRVLKDRVDNLADLVKQGIDIDANFTKLEIESSELEDQHLALMKEHYNPAKNPAEKPKTTLEEIAKKVEERTKEVDRLERSFKRLHSQIATIYTDTRDALPGTGPLNLKPFSTLTASPASEDSQPPRKKQRLGGSDSS